MSKKKKEKVRVLVAAGSAAIMAALVYGTTHLILGSAENFPGGSVAVGALVGWRGFPRRWASHGMIVGGVVGFGAFLLLRTIF